MAKIVDFIDAVDLAKAKTERLSYSTSRARRAASATAGAASDAYTSVGAFLDHIGGNPPSAAVSDRYISEQVATSHTQAGATVKAVRAVSALDACVKHRHIALEAGNRLHASLDASIQDNDGEIRT